MSSYWQVGSLSDGYGIGIVSDQKRYDTIRYDTIQGYKTRVRLIPSQDWKEKMNWGDYLCKGVYLSNEKALIYHMCDKEAFYEQTQGGKPYYPPTYSMEGFVHATKEPNMLLGVGNHFYKSVPGEWICLALDPQFLNAEVRFEAAAPVGNTAALPKDTPVDASVPIFPHIYGGIYRLAVVGVYPIERGEDGGFLNIRGLSL